MLTESHLGIPPVQGLRLSSQSSAAPDRTPHERWVCIWTSEAIPVAALPLSGEPERSAAVLLTPPHQRPIIVFGSVLPWRSDTRRDGLRGGAAFVDALREQETDIVRLRAEHRDARFLFIGDLNQEVDVAGPVGTPLGRVALRRFLDSQGLIALTGGSGDPLRRWRDSIDHIIIDAASAPLASAPEIWPEQFPLPGRPWPDHHGVEVTLAAV